MGLESPGEELLSFTAQFDVDRFHGAMTVHNGKVVRGLEALELLFHEALIFEEAIKHIENFRQRRKDR